MNILCNGFGKVLTPRPCSYVFFTSRKSKFGPGFQLKHCNDAFKFHNLQSWLYFSWFDLFFVFCFFLKLLFFPELKRMLRENFSRMYVCVYTFIILRLCYLEEDTFKEPLSCFFKMQLLRRKDRAKFVNHYFN